MPSTAPLLFVIQDARTLLKSRADAKVIASHVSARYKPWKKTNRKTLVLHSTTKAILTSKSTNGRDAITKRAPKAEYEEYVEVLEEYHRQMLEKNEYFSDGFSRKTFMFQKGNNDTWHIFECFLDLKSSTVGSSVLDPFTPTSVKYDLEIKSNIHFYFKVIRPYAKRLVQGWDWFDNLSYIQSSPVLAYAVAAYASVFLSGCLRGGPGVVLPPAPTAEGQRSLWPIPPWLRLQTSCLAELSALLSDSGRVDESCYQAILFLFRLSVLLADGKTARMHYKALKQMTRLIGIEDISLNVELAVAKVNIIAAFLHNQSIVVVRTQSPSSHSRVKQIVEIDRKLWTSDREWYNHQASLAGRLLTWRSEGPSGQLQRESAASLARLDPDSRLLEPSQYLEMQRCYQIALYFSISLNHISFNTAAPEIRTNLTILRSKLFNMDLVLMSQLCHCTLFNILLHGAMAGRGHWERGWFIKLLATLYEDARYVDDVYNLLVEFIDPFGIVFSVIEEIWEDVLKFRASQSTLVGKMDLYQGAVVRPVEQNRPITYSPNLTTPTEIIDVATSDMHSRVEID